MQKSMKGRKVTGYTGRPLGTDGAIRLGREVAKDRVSRSFKSR